MKAETIKERPEYELLKQNDVTNYHNLQIPRWLIADRRYMYISLEAKFIYALLFNRFQISKLNGWINDYGEVFVIYTRKELSDCLHISEKRITSAMNELNRFKLIWERRCGRGFANQIYLANVKITNEDAVNANGGPLDPSESTLNFQKSRTDETAGLEKTEEKEESVLFSGNDNYNEQNISSTEPLFPIISKTKAQEPPLENFKNRQNSGSKTSGLTVQEPPNLPPNNKELNYKDISYINHSQSKSSHYCAREQQHEDRRIDADNINKLLEMAEIDFFPEDEATVIKDAIERLYFMQSIKIGNAVYPNERIRSNLWRLDSSVVQDAISKITKNTGYKIRNSSAYVVTVLFNTIMESTSDLLVDPYLNQLRNRPIAKASRDGGG